MKHLQLKYNILQILFWMSGCAVMAYGAVFLQYKGFSNTEIGIVSGGASLANIFLSPYLSGIVNKIPQLNIKNLLTGVFIGEALIFLMISFIPFPSIIIMILYIILWSLVISVVPFLSTLVMNLISVGENVNFGLARGLGSLSYATSAVLLGQLVNLKNPTYLSYVFFISSVLFIAVLYTFPLVEDKSVKSESSISMIGVAKKYPTLFFMLLGLTFTFAGSSTLSTYLINIVKSLGGDASLYGIAIFFMAASELPVMTLSPLLMKRFNSVLLMMVSGVFYILRNFTIALAFSLPMVFIGSSFQSLSYALFTGVITYYVTYHLDKDDQIMGQTLIAVMSTGLGSMIGNVSGGVLSDVLGMNSMLMFACILTVIGSAIMIITGLRQGKSLLQTDMRQI